MENRIQTYQEFWPFYLSQHLNSISRALHFGGTLGAFSFLGLSFLFGPQFLVLALLCGYGPAWVMLQGQLPQELERYQLPRRS